MLLINHYHGHLYEIYIKFNGCFLITPTINAQQSMIIFKCMQSTVCKDRSKKAIIVWTKLGRIRSFKLLLTFDAPVLGLSSSSSSVRNSLLGYGMG